MKILKRIGILITIIALLCALGIVGKIETEEKEYQGGEITREEMTTDSDLIKNFALYCGAAALGGSMWAVGAYVEADKIERKYKRFYR